VINKIFHSKGKKITYNINRQMTITRMTNEIVLVEFNTKVFEHRIPNIYAKYVIFCYFFFKSCSSFTFHLDDMVSLETCSNKPYMLEIKWCNPSSSKRLREIMLLPLKTFEKALVEKQKFNKH
jgi:hypothetical protein